jgi:threonyl-tRNA synthetase
MQAQKTVRVCIDEANETLGKKIREGEKKKIPYILVVGEKEEHAKNCSVRQRSKGDIGTMNVDAFVAMIEKHINEKYSA